MEINLKFDGRNHRIQVLKIEQWGLEDLKSGLAIAGVESDTDDYLLPAWAGIVTPYRGKHSQVTKLINMIRANDGIKSHEEFLEFVRRAEEEGEKISILKPEQAGS